MGKKEPEPETLEEFCKVCGRVRWGDIQRVGHGKWRHDSCGYGSLDWREYVERLPVGLERDTLAPLLALNNPEKGTMHHGEATA